MRNVFKTHREFNKPIRHMKTNDKSQTYIIEGGKDRFEETDQFNTRVKEIRREVADKYSQKISNEKNLVRRLLLIVRMKLETRNRIHEVSSSKNLH